MEVEENGHDAQMLDDAGNGNNILLAVGVIYPPPEIRGKPRIADKAAEYFAKNGPSFEERIRENEKHNPKFSFLNPNDPYRAYYEHKIREFQTKKDLPEGKDDEKGGEARKPIVPVEVKPPPPEPPKFEFMADPPPISTQDLDIVKLTAQFVARNGRQFMASLASREQRNYQFDFLRPNHSVFPYFIKLVDQYAKVLLPSKETLSGLEQNFDNKPVVLKRIIQRVEFNSWMDEQKKKAEQEADQERIAFAMIDWHDFVVVDTIEFVESDEMLDLPPPMTLTELENMTLAQRKTNLVLNQDTFQDGGDMEMDVDEEPAHKVSLPPRPGPVSFPPPNMAPPSSAPPPPLPGMPVAPPSIRAEGSLKVVSGYVPKAASRPGASSEPTQTCPRCGQAIPISEMDEHVRIELLDPKWREQRQRAQAKQGDSNLNMGVDVAKNLSRLSDYRTDIFGSEETSVGRRIAEEREKAAGKERIVWDGHSGSIPSATMAVVAGQSVDEQIAARQRYQQQLMDEANKIGPQMGPGPTTTAPPPSFTPTGPPSFQPPPAMPQQLPPAYNQPPPQQSFGQPPPSFNPPPFIPGMPPMPMGVPPMPRPVGLPPLPIPGTMASMPPPPSLPGIPPLPRPVAPIASLPPPPLPPILARPIPPMPPVKPITKVPEDRTDSDAKRQKMDEPATPTVPGGALPGYLPEAEWIQQHPDAFEITIQPQEGPSFTIPDLKSDMLTSALMEKIKGITAIAPSKQKLVVRGKDVLLGRNKLAFYNLKGGDVIAMSTRVKK
ncbi:hypothetical protein SmJEL517_g02062 [Synchytrium microbalum]|uniref:SURP motif domain-containing protein n=1 Tax=Synchytrium microbalum TaxID=1806994 RepID=A0A507CDC6_9FUNG|nr:uncharacterized protein SmJEL517_g02062 [Synchytrium microbalum]TPX35543.1 hypothetical protein SmJEL517_g02062 [Synchytrium microbalum]